MEIIPINTLYVKNKIVQIVLKIVLLLFSSSVFSGTSTHVFSPNIKINTNVFLEKSLAITYNYKFKFSKNNVSTKQKLEATSINNSLEDNFSYGFSAKSDFFEETSSFITTWKVEGPNNSITIPTKGEGYNYHIDWGDGKSEQITDGVIARHVYAEAKTYTVHIRGDFPRIYFNNTGDKDKLLSINQWGDIQWTSMEKAFYGCSNLRIIATDAPDLSQVSNMNNMFRSASALNDPINHWNVDNVRTMKFIFAGAINFNQDLSSWNVSNVTNMSGMFFLAKKYNQNLGNWDIGKLRRTHLMLSNSGLSIENYDATLMGWSSKKTIPKDLKLHANGLEYCLSEDSRTNLQANYGWTLRGDRKSCELEAKSSTTTITNKKVATINSSAPLSVYPNPADDRLFIRYNLGSLENVVVQIVDISGRTLIRSTAVRDIAIGKLSKGMYFLKVHGKGKTKVVKFLKN